MFDKYFWSHVKNYVYFLLQISVVATRDSFSCRTSLTVEDTGAACMGRVSPPVALKVICLTETTDAVLRT